MSLSSNQNKKSKTKFPLNQNHENMKHIYLLLVSLILFSIEVEAQSLTQVIRGKIVDLDSKTPLVGVTLFIDGSSPIIGTVTDGEGSFVFPSLPLGRYNIGVSYIGYENKVVPNLLLGAGKEVFLNIDLEESVEQLEEAVVTARKNKGEAMNDMATVSSRTISVEETQRFAGSFNDPARLVSSYAGVMGNPDGDNDIMVRGNSPRGVQWRVEGVDVPNPNHFANEGATGGPISILNNTTLGNCDFFTGAFPANYGDAYSGVFDVHLRKGNNKNQEYTAQIGIIGMDLTAEGPLMQNSSASYLVNYRYSSLDMMNRIGIKIVGDAVPKFQDMTFNVNIPTLRTGTFQFFGIGGLSNIAMDEINWKESFSADMGVFGMNHFYSFSPNTYLKTTLSFSGTRNIWDYYESEVEPVSWDKRGSEEMFYRTYALSTELTHKVSARHTFKLGVTGKLMDYDLGMENYDWDENVLYTSLEDYGSSELFQSYVNWKYRPFSKLTFNTGMAYKYFNLNGNYALEPRAGLRWQATASQSFTAGVGMHSKTDNISIYLMRERLDDGSVVQHNKDLDFVRAKHYVIGYENRITRNLNLKVEAYYQDLYDVPVAAKEGSVFSILNVSHGYLEMDMVNKGTGTNKGAEISLEKFFSKNYYFMITTSLFESKYKAIDGIERNSRYNNNYIANVVGGKEFPVGKKKNSAITVNVRGSYAGGQWYTPINIEESMEAGYSVRLNEDAYTEQRPDYYRFDLKVGFRRNKKNTTRVWELDMQNATNTLNVAGDYWDSDLQEVVSYSQMGILPVLSYRIEF